MIIEIDKLEEGVVIYDEKKKHFTILPFSSLTEELKNEVTNLKENLDSFKAFKNQYTKENVVKEIKELTNKFDNDKVKENLVIINAYQLLNDDINYKGIEEPIDYDKIREYVFNPKRDKNIPTGLKPYVEMIIKKEDE